MGQMLTPLDSGKDWRQQGQGSLKMGRKNRDRAQAPLLHEEDEDGVHSSGGHTANAFSVAGMMLPPGAQRCMSHSPPPSGAGGPHANNGKRELSTIQSSGLSPGVMGSQKLHLPLLSAHTELLGTLDSSSP